MAAPLQPQPDGLGAGLLEEGAQRRFTFSVDLRRFEAGSRLPLNLASVVLELALPTELAGAPLTWHSHAGWQGGVQQA